MKRWLCFCLNFLAVICVSLLMTAAASADVEGFIVDLPDSIEVGLKEKIDVLYVKPENRQSADVTFTCSDPDAVSCYTFNMGTDLYYGITMNEKGHYTWHFTVYGETIKDVSVTVKDLVTVTADQALYVVPHGKSVPFSYTIGSGTIYDWDKISIASYSGV